jgi:hypothetical protein
MLGLFWVYFACLPLFDTYVFAVVIVPGSSSAGSTYRLSARDVAPLYHSATSADITAARVIVKESIAKASVLNKARLDRLARSNYHLKHGNARNPIWLARSGDDAEDVPLPLLRITPEIVKAAALVTEVNAMANFSSSSTIKSRTGGRYWTESVTRRWLYPTA